MSQCKFCHADGLEWHENLRKLVNPITGKQHGFVECTPSKIPLYEQLYGITIPRYGGYVAADIVREAIKLGLDPYHVRTKRDGDNLVIITN